MDSKVYGRGDARVVQSVARALRILDELAEVPEAGVVELGVAAGLSPSTTHRLLATLCDAGYAVHDPGTRRYRLGPQLLAAASAADHALGGLRAAAAPAMAPLRDDTDETVNLVVLDRAQIVYVDQVESSRSVRAFNRIGNRVPAHASGAGKALLAHLPESALEEFVAAAPFPALTATTITSAHDLLAHLGDVRRRGFALDEGEFDEDVICVGAAIIAPGGGVPGALSVSGPSSRMRRRDLDDVGRRVAAAAATVGPRL